MRLFKSYCTRMLILWTIVASSARPTNLEENSQGCAMNFVSGLFVGVETLLALTGYYEDDQVKQGISTEKLIIDPVEIQDQTEIKVVGLGLGRTGSTSLVIALETLGYSVVHDDEQTELTDLYAAEERGDIDIDEFHDILGKRGFNSTFKTADYKWVARNPEVKAILTIRDNPDKYVDSWMQAAPFMELLERPPFCWMKTAQILFSSLEMEYKEETTNGNPDNYLDKDTLRKHYISYVEKVQESIPSHRLLIFNVKQGWEPLCKFLNKPIPEGVPFPHVHNRAKLQGEMYLLGLITWIWPLAIIVPFATLMMLSNRFFTIISYFYKSVR